MHGSSNVEFMGVLIDRQYTSSQKCIQLVFETAEGIRLSLSRNINMARSLTLGLTYKVKGLERTIGQKRYVHEPTATLLPVAATPFFKRYKILVPAVVSLAVVIGGVGTFAFASSGSTAQPTAVEKKSAPSATTAKSTAPALTPTTTQQSSESTSPLPQSQSTTSTTSTKKTTSVAAKTITPSKSTPAPVVASDAPSAPTTPEPVIIPTDEGLPAGETLPSTDPSTPDPTPAP